MPRIGLIGPVLPYRGGISHYTTMLHRSLGLQAELLTISFKRLYPKWLYPGKSVLDPGYKGYHEPGVFYILDSLNPLTWAQARNMLIKHRPCGVIIPWWSSYWSTCFGFIARFLRRRGIRIIFLCHNVKEHEPAFWKEKLTSFVFAQGSAFLVHAKEEADRLKKMIPKAKIAVHPHPIFHQFPHPEKNPPRRSKLELLFFGFVRPYKGVDILLKAIHLLKEEDIYLTIAGEWWGNKKMLLKLIDDLDIKNKVEVIDRYLSEQEVAECFSRADIVVLPYRSATGSGVISLAYHYGKPVITTVVGGLPDVVADGVSGRLVKPEDPHALAEGIREFLYTPPNSMQEGVEKVAKQMTWESLAGRILDFVNCG